MYTKFACPQCGKGLKVKEELAGQKARCPHCKHQVTIPAPAPPSPEEGAVDWNSIVSDSSETTANKPTPKGAPAAATGAPAPTTQSGSSGDVSLLWSALIGLGLTVLYLGLLFPLQSTYIGQLFLNRGWVPFVETFLFMFAVAFLAMKFLKLRKQREAMLFDFLPTELSDEINATNVNQFIGLIRTLPAAAQESVLGNRVLRCLEHFKVRNSNPEVASVLSTLSDIDANAVASSYSLVKVCNWAIPILGFIGTVIGIGNAVSGLSSNIDAAGDIEALKGQLGTITAGLGVAFDTTLVALVMSLIISFPASTMQKSEEDLLNEVDDYCNENLLLRLKDGSTQTSAPPGGDWSKVVESAVAAQQSIAKAAEQNMKQLLDQFSQNLKQIAQNSQASQASMASAVERAVTEVSAVERGLSSLSNVLEQLGGERVTVEVHQQPKRGWSLFGRKNGVSGNG